MQALPHLSACCGQVWTVCHVFSHAHPGGTLWPYSVTMSFCEEAMAGLLWQTSLRLDGATYGYCCLRGSPSPREFLPLLLSHCHCVSGCGLLSPLTVSIASKPSRPSRPSSGLIRAVVRAMLTRNYTTTQKLREYLIGFNRFAEKAHPYK